MTEAPIWTPSDRRIESANLTRFIGSIADRHCLPTRDYDALWTWSIEHRDTFWEAVWNFCGVQASRPAERTLIEGERLFDAQWFSGARLNFAENLLTRNDASPAIIAWNENGRSDLISFAQLRRRVADVAGWMRTQGIQPGDRVAALMPNVPETVIGMLAATSLGAVFSSCSPDFGVDGVIERFGQIEPKLLIAAEGCRYAGKQHDLLPRVGEIMARLPTLQATLLVPSGVGKAGVGKAGGGQPDTTNLPGAVLWNDLPAADTDLQFRQLPFDHPLYIMFSSGTTGVPKCIVHGAGGTLLQHVKEHVLHTDLKRDDRLFYFTTCGWMMWNWLVSGLASGAAIVLYDGSPAVRGGNILFDLAADERVTALGASAAFFSASQKSGLTPRQTHDLTSLRTILSTGSPLLPECFDYVYQQIATDVHLASISGGTDLISCFALGNPMGPVWRGQLQCPGLGMAVDVFDAEGHSIVGRKGELVCRAAFPSMPIYFWNDPDRSRYFAAYFDKVPNVWAHGDYAERTPQGGLIIFGRSDAVLNRGGVRIGTAEIYRQVEQVAEVVDSIAIEHQAGADTRIVLFVRLVDNLVLDDALIERIKSQIRSGASPRHVPDDIVQVPDIPRTKSGKKVELAVRDVVHGRDVRNRNALANPEALDHFPRLSAH